MNPTNLQHSISSPTYPCVLTPAEFPSKEHESKVPKPPLKCTAPPWVINIYHYQNEDGLTEEE